MAPRVHSRQYQSPNSRPFQMAWRQCGGQQFYKKEIRVEGS